MLRAREKKKYIARKRKREQNKAKYAGKPMSDHYKKNIDSIPIEDLGINCNTNTTTSSCSQPPTKKQKYSCSKCNKQYVYKASCDKHIQTCKFPVSNQ